MNKGVNIKTASKKNGFKWERFIIHGFVKIIDFKFIWKSEDLLGCVREFWEIGDYNL